MSKFKLVICGLSLSLLGGLSGFVVSRIARASWNMDNWGGDQWGPVAAWLAGIATIGAVVLAFNQSKQARQDAKEANSRLDRELDASRRMEQIKAIPPIWESLRLLAEPTLNLITAMNVVNSHIETRIRLEEDVTQSDLAPLNGVKLKWMTTFTQVEASFSPALMLIEEKETSKVIATLYYETCQLQEMALEMIKGFPKSVQCNPKDLSKQLTVINSMRTTLVATVREHLTKVAPLKISAVAANPLANPTTPPRPETPASEEFVAGPA
ncbi:hypothetical protein M2405_006323 [Rhodococcus erythropolis]|uniref:hypothetical protein n=1 Tax=Rhodococcus erythropolis TaxID=1833 RepID=UPI002166FB7C|nr:hypothetical protein [Rhodococcus erythropolis]MCS4257996.1 hypothetical protein [Rhodococcus erythropolis]MCW2430109.1 hypothetical protein [Rhodococcus erythropolis]